MKNFIQKTRHQYEKSKEFLFESLLPEERLGIVLHAEDSEFIRLNQSKLRQATSVTQVELKLTLQSKGKSSNLKFNISNDFYLDKALLKEKLELSRSLCESLPLDPHQVLLTDSGHSRMDIEGSIPEPPVIMGMISEEIKDEDLAGIYCAGPLIQASSNSLGQDHWFSTNGYFFDYSLYNGAKAAKGFISDVRFNPEHLGHSLQHTKEMLHKLSLPVVAVPPGKYKCYLEPSAVAELFGTMSWGGFSAQAFKRELSPFKKLGTQEINLSKKFSVQENFELGLSPLFNSNGELSEHQVALVSEGRLVQFLTSSRSAKEYTLKANGASESESLRSCEVLPGGLREEEILKELDTGLYLSNLHYCNWSEVASARITGMTRYACFWVKNGQIKGPIQDLRFDVSLLEAFGTNLIDLSQDQESFPNIWTYGSRQLGGLKLPGMLIDQVPFTL